MHIVSKDFREDAWLEAIKHLLKNDNLEYNLILEVKKPNKHSTRSKTIKSKIDSLLREAEGLPVQCVADTIFPAKIYRAYGIEGIFTKYPDEIYPLIQKEQANARGTYAYRLARGFDDKGKECNPLKLVIDRLKSQLARTNGGIRCAFELSLYSHTDDSIAINRNDSSVMGFPCLSHLSFKLSKDRKSLHLTAIYRSQHYVRKAVGNLLGLARLQSAVAKEIGIEVGSLVCHATMATLDKDIIGKTKLNTLIKNIEEEFDETSGL
jgi:thymidylate synthase